MLRQINEALDQSGPKGIEAIVSVKIKPSGAAVGRTVFDSRQVESWSFLKVPRAILHRG